MSITVSALLHGISAVICLAWMLFAAGVGRGRSALLLAAAGGAAALWAAAVALSAATPLTGIAAVFEILRSAVWFAVLVEFCRRIGGRSAAMMTPRLIALGLAVTLLALASLLPGVDAALTLPGLGSVGLLARMTLALLVVLMAENLYRNAPEAARWHVVLPCIALGGLSAFDLVLYLDATLSRSFSPGLLDARAVLTALTMPLLAIAAVRDRRALRELPVSREFVFHGTTLVIVGTFLLGVGAVSESLRQLADPWAGVARVTLLGAAVMAVLVALSARSVRSRLRSVMTDHFFRARYDYRAEWLRCIATLTLPQTEVTADVRAVRALADAVDSPAGALLLREPGTGRLAWEGAWNGRPAQLTHDVEAEITTALREGTWIAAPGPTEMPGPRASFTRLWLIVPLMHHRDGLIGAVVLDRPRAPFGLNGEVFDLLRMLGREVAMFLAERRSAERLAEQVRVEAYASRFAFVAHDVKTVASQLTLLLGNAATNIHDPEFQQDMLMTVRAAADRINTLIARLRSPTEVQPQGFTEPLPRLRAIASRCCHPVEIEHDGTLNGTITMPPEHFDAAVTHLLNNAIEASAQGQPVRLRLTQQEGRQVLAIIDSGPGMSAGFVRDVLFRPLLTSKPNGSGIGVWQARELLRRAGGDLEVTTSPGAGTTMRLLLPEAASALQATRPNLIKPSPMMAAQ